MVFSRRVHSEYTFFDLESTFSLIFIVPLAFDGLTGEEWVDPRDSKKIVWGPSVFGTFPAKNAKIIVCRKNHWDLGVSPLIFFWRYIHTRLEIIVFFSGRPRF